MKGRAVWSLSLRAWAWIVRVEWRRRRERFDRLVARLESLPSRGRRAIGAEEAVRAIRCAYDRSPFRGSCLEVSLAALGLLRSLGYPARLVIGVERTAAPVEAHAWIEIDGVSLDPGSAPYTPLRRPPGA